MFTIYSAYSDREQNGEVVPDVREILWQGDNHDEAHRIWMELHAPEGLAALDGTQAVTFAQAEAF